VSEESTKRKLVAILSADVKGYSRLMADDEEATVRTITAYREVMVSHIRRHNGRVVDAKGDNVLAEFPSVVDAVRCSVEVQNELKGRNAELQDHRRMQFRIGVNLGDVIEEEEAIYGDGVNVAARLEALAGAGGICISGTAYDHVKNKLTLGYEYLGEQTVKNIPEPVRVYKVLMEPEAAGKLIGEKKRPRISLKSVIAILVVLIALAVWNFYLRKPSTLVEVASVERMAFPLPDKPSVAVLPFANMSGDPSQEYIGDGISENIITALSNISEIFVIARNSTFTYKGKPVKVQQVSEELGVRYVLEGSVQKAGHRVRVTAQLVDATTGQQLWAERYDRELKDLFALQDEITVKILTALQVQLTEGEQARTWHTTDKLEAWGYVVKGGDLFGRFSKEDNAKARKLFERASEIDPGYALALTMLAWTHFIDAWLGYSESRTESIQRAVELAKKSGSIDGNQPAVHSLWGSIYLTQGQYEKAISAGQKAIALGPNNAICHALLAYTMNFAGRFQEAIVLAEKSIRLMPYCTDWFLWILAQSYRQAGRYEKALSTYKKAKGRSRKNEEIYRGSTIGLVDVCIQLGRVEEARAYASELLTMMPNFSLEGFRKIYAYKDPAHLERILVNLEKAGLK
jgi:adenylate cyclase